MFDIVRPSTSYSFHSSAHPYAEPNTLAPPNSVNHAGTTLQCILFPKYCDLHFGLLGWSRGLQWSSAPGMLLGNLDNAGLGLLEHHGV